MVRTLAFALPSAALAIAAGVLFAQERASPAEASHEAREAHMHLQSLHLGQLAPMAQGSAEFDAAVAQSAADNLHHLAQMLEASLYWVPGSAQGEVEGSQGLPAIWENPEEHQAQIAAFQEATAALQAAAGTDQASLQGALQGVGQVCGSCHEAFRAESE